MRVADLGWLTAVGLIAAVGLSLKFFVGEHYEMPDVPAATRIVHQRLSEAAFSIDPPRFAREWRLAARRGDCALLAGVTDDMGQNFALWQREARNGGILRFHYRGTSSAEFPRWRGPIGAQIQMFLSRLGISAPRPAIVATIERGHCGGMVPDLRNIAMPMQKLTRAI